MFLKNLQYAFRSLNRNRFYTLINITGLAVGIAAALLIFGWTQNERSYDRFFENGDRMVRIISNWDFGGTREWSATTPAPLAPAMKEEIPELEAVTRFWRSWGGVFTMDDTRMKAENVIFVEPSFFQVFGFKLTKGDPATALSAPGSIVLTESMAQKFFGADDPMGKHLRYDQLELTVTGITGDCPGNSHLQFSSLIPFDGNVPQFVGGKEQMHWHNFSYLSYALLLPDADKTTVEDKINALYKTRAADPENKEDAQTFFQLQPVGDIYLHSQMLNYNGFPSGDPTTIWIIAGIGLLILVIACINYVNLTTARAAHRAKDTGIRKIAGAARGQLFGQFMTETTLLVLIAGLAGVVLADKGLPLFEQLSGKELTEDQLFNLPMLGILVGTGLAAILLSGIQPALQLSAFNPARVLRGSGWKMEKNRMRRMLVIGQFVCSSVLVICTLLMFNQMEYVKSTKLGYTREHIFTFYSENGNLEPIKAELLSEPGIIDVVSSDQPIVNIGSMYGGANWEGKTEDQPSQFWTLNVDERFPAFFGLELKEGRWFLPGKADSTSFVINEAAARYMNLEEPVGKWIDYNDVKGTIAGVVRDFHFKSLHNRIEPLIIREYPKWHWLINVKTTGADAAKAIASTERVFKKHNPTGLFSYDFLDESYNQLYKTETRSGNLFMVFAGIAILISCLGILGLAAYSAERRTKEIGIRKVLGSTVTGIVTLLSGDFLKLILIALVIAIPLGWYFMHKWLQNFAYRIPIEWWVFAAAGTLIIAIAFLTVAFHAVKAALTNPSSSLKVE